MNRLEQIRSARLIARFALALHVRRVMDARCTHTHWNFKQHGRMCTCGTLMLDFGD